MLILIKSVTWSVALALIITAGLYFSLKLSFPQFKFKRLLKVLITRSEDNPIKSLFIALAGRIGVGSIAGVALAIYLAGPGTIFWMWVIALVTGSLTYAESYLAIKYKKNIAGPPCYIKYGLGKNKLAIAYALIVIIAYLIGFIPVQASTVVKSINLNELIIGPFLFLISLLILKKGIKNVVNLTTKIIPLMGIIYISMTIYVIIININHLPEVLKIIFQSALNTKSFFASFIPMVIVGIQRGIFSNESGLGLGAFALGTSKTNNPKSGALVQVVGIYIVTMVVCTASAIILLMTPYAGLSINDINGIEITKYAFAYHFGDLGSTLLSICILLFAFSTVLSGYYYTTSSAYFIIKKHPKILKILVPLSVLFGSLASPSIIWDLVDIMVGIMAVINIYSLYKLRKQIK